MAAWLEAARLILGIGLSLLVLAGTAFVLGRVLTGELDRAVERWAVPTALGLAGLAHLGFLLGLAGLLRPAAVLGPSPSREPPGYFQLSASPREPGSTGTGQSGYSART